MGVPGLFLWLLKKYNSDNLLLNKESINIVDSLLIDTNCLLHPQCFKILDQYKNLNINELECKMIDSCISYIDYLISFTSPEKLVYISIDGVAPCAKIKQQRLRRFKSAKDKRLYNNLKKKYNKPLDNSWTNASITPGTRFMEKLDKKIKEYITEKRKKCQYKIIYSSCYIESEGEHKLLQYIRNTNTKYNNYVIYGLDADLIFLSLSSFKDNVYLLRESNVINKRIKEKLVLVSIDTIKDYLLEEFKVYIKDIKLIKKRIITDFIFICFLLGNDFLPHIPSINISAHKNLINGLDLIIYCYCKSFNIYNNYILELSNNKVIFNIDFLINFIDNLIIFENDYFINNYKVKKYYNKYRGNDQYEKELHKIDNLQFKIIDNIELGKDKEEKWKSNYYHNYYNIINNYDNIVSDACYEYFKGLIWNSYYYFYKCPSWNWYYKYNYSPFISDLRKYIKNFNFNDFNFEIGKPLKPQQQLLCVLPPQFAFLLSSSYKYLMLNNNSPLIYLYPRDFKLDMINKHKYWQCIPIIPNMDFNLIKLTEKFKLTNEEEHRNRNEKLF